MAIQATVVGVLNYARFNLDAQSAWAARLLGTTYDDGRALVVVRLEGENSADLTALQALIAAHDPDNLTPDQLAAAKVEATLETADTKAAAIPGWATWTEAQTVNYITANVTDLASAKVVLVAMARMLVALRNKTWPHLQD